MAIRFLNRSASKPDEPPLGDDGLVRMTLVEHLAELRHRIIVSIIAIAVGAVVGWLLYNHLLNFMREPYCQAITKRHLSKDKCDLFITEPLQGVSTRLKVAGYTGLVLSLPVLLFQLWRFITPGLHPKEKRYAIPFVVVSVLLFALGGLIAVLTFPQAIDFLISVSGANVQTLFTPSSYVSLYTLVIIAFGVAFEFPVVLVFLELANILTPKKLMGWWRYAIVGIFIFAAVITPSQDPYSLLGMAVPMTVFYFMSAGVGKLLGK